MHAPARLWIATTALMGLNCLMFSQIASYSRELGYGGWCGTWAMKISTNMDALAILAVPIALLAICDERRMRFVQLSRVARTCLRLSVCILVAQIATWFALLPIVSRLL